MVLLTRINYQHVAHISSLLKAITIQVCVQTVHQTLTMGLAGVGWHTLSVYVYKYMYVREFVNIGMV